MSRQFMVPGKSLSEQVTVPLRAVPAGAVVPPRASVSSLLMRANAQQIREIQREIDELMARWSSKIGQDL